MDTESPSHEHLLGQHIRAMRRSRQLTLVQLAALAELSHPFLSQLERGLTRPSMVSLEKIARALGSSQLELLSGAADLARGLVTSTPTLVRAGEGDTGPYSLGHARLLVQGDRRFHPMLFTASNADPGEYHQHDEDEFLHVISGRCVVDLADQGTFELAPEDSLYYVGGSPHRWFSPDGEPYRLFVVKEHFAVRDLDSVWDPALALEMEEAQ
ncbi:helix-turn-helix domain-containing protein [Marisediminicola sp. LYQ85]|uniref:helix-turn-helix domain-containing protein n=1 Tax=Marisediminicola sp. LYQ85 TaxID=3391062 RepID=UPI0039838C40